MQINDGYMPIPGKTGEGMIIMAGAGVALQKTAHRIDAFMDAVSGYSGEVARFQENLRVFPRPLALEWETFRFFLPVSTGGWNNELQPFLDIGQQVADILLERLGEGQIPLLVSQDMFVKQGQSGEAPDPKAIAGQICGYYRLADIGEVILAVCERIKTSDRGLAKSYLKYAGQCFAMGDGADQSLRQARISDTTLPAFFKNENSLVAISMPMDSVPCGTSARVLSVS